MLQFLDNLCNDIFTGEARMFPYKSFSETLHLVLLSLLREMLSQQDLAPVFVNEIQVYVKKVSFIFIVSSIFPFKFIGVRQRAR